MATIHLKPGSEKPLLRRHPWIYSGAIRRVEGNPASGETVGVRAADGLFLARGAWSPQSQIRVRVWTFDENEPVDAKFFRERLRRAVDTHRALLSGAPQHTACRLVNAESDGLPGLIVDRYGPWLVCQILTAGAEVWRDVLVTELAAITGCEGIWERSDVDVRPKEGLSPRTGLMHGVEPPEVVEIHEGAARYLVDIRNGQKTGFYLDQRENRARAAEYAAGAEVLNVFSYTGGFTISALLAGARKVVNVDASAPALEFLDRNVALNEIDPVRVENVGGNAFEVLRRFREEGRRFDLIVVDPPKLVSSRANLQRATRGYKDINLQAFSLLQPGGILFTFSCSGLLDRDLFQKIVADAALDARREARILRYLSQSPDHPISMPFPEGLYLKGLVCQTL